MASLADCWDERTLDRVTGVPQNSRGFNQSAAATTCFCLLRREIQPIRPSPLAKSGSAAGTGVESGSPAVRCHALRSAHSNAGLPEYKTTERKVEPPSVISTKS